MIPSLQTLVEVLMITFSLRRTKFRKLDPREVRKLVAYAALLQCHEEGVFGMEETLSLRLYDSLSPEAMIVAKELAEAVVGIKETPHLLEFYQSLKTQPAPVAAIPPMKKSDFYRKPRKGKQAEPLPILVKISNDKAKLLSGFQKGGGRGRRA